MKPITFLSDYGYEDEFAGTCRAVIEAVAPGATVIDISHGIPPQDVQRGAFALLAALPHAPEGVHLAVVDPGVGTSRRPVAISVRDSDRVLVGPDNGLLWPALERLGGAGEAVDLSASPFCREPVSATFHGRDIFAPVSARLAGGAELADAGTPIDPDTLARIARRPPVIADDHVAAHVAVVDHFGNAVLDLPAERMPPDLFEAGAPVCIEVGGERHEAVFGRTFGDVAEGGTLVYEDATRNLAIAVNRGSAAAALGIVVDEQLLLRRGR
ncbi:MAG: SAM hydrolase/SAM-dependent halogenase family protein [Solirubrobacterales bacterium]